MWDYLEIFELEDNGLPNTKELGKFCGLVNFGPIHSSSNKVFFVFHSDYIVPKKGFKLYIATIGKLQNKIRFSWSEITCIIFYAEKR